MVAAIFQPKLKLLLTSLFLLLVLPAELTFAQGESGASSPSTWNVPASSSLQLGISTTVEENVITYALYPKVIERERLWDLKINIPLPQGVSLVAIEAPPLFTTNFDGREVSFFTLELAAQIEVEPLIFKVSTDGLADPLIITHAWATWKNEGFNVGVTIPTEEQITIAAIVVQPNVPERVVFDTVGDVPLPNYDLENIAFQEGETTFTVIFNMAGPIAPAGQPVQYTLYIDSDCRSDTGEPTRYRGAEYRVNYNQETDRATLTTWDGTAQDWLWEQAIKLDSLVESQQIAIAMDYYLIGEGRQFCWIARAVDETVGYNFELPSDWLPNEEFLNLTQHEIAPAPTDTISGKLAVPLNNQAGFYDVSLFSLPGGQKTATIANARQPNFNADGQRLLTNHESVAPESAYEKAVSDDRTAVYVFKNYNVAENIFEYNLVDGTEKQVSDGARDAYPFYDPQGNRLVYSNPELLAQSGDAQASFLFAQCSLLPPGQEAEQGCRELAKFRLLTGPAGEVWGSYPIWTGNNMIAYRGCAPGSETKACGIYLIDVEATPGNDQGVAPVQLTVDTTDIPADTQGNLLTFTSQREGNWEAYLINLDGTGLRNLSNEPNANDGLPTLSPDGRWVAFVSDRQGSWAVWAVPVMGSFAQKLFDLPTDTPWGNDDRAWTNERISWGW